MRLPARNAAVGVPAFFVYTAIVSVTVLHHEPWFDEAQAWLLARDLPWWDLMGRYLRYEGSPGLWHTLLWLAQRVGLPYASLNVVSAVLGALGAFLFFFFAPFPQAIRLLFPFTFFPLFQYAVVSRSYALYFPLLCFVALLYPGAEKRILLFAALLCLIANVSLHGILIGAGIAFGYGLESRSRWAQMPLATRQKHVLALAMFMLTIIFIVWQLRPPPDQAIHAAFSFDARKVIGTAIYILQNAMTGSRLLALPVLAVSGWWFWRQGILWIYVVSTGLVCLLFGVVYGNVWHEGVLVLVWAFCMWLAARRSGGSLPKPVWAVWCLVLAIQLYWSVVTIRMELKGNYSGGPPAAAWLRHHLRQDDRTFAFGFNTISILPYFPANIFNNYEGPGAFWWWSKQNRMDDTLPDVVSERPETVVLGVKSTYPAGWVSRRTQFLKDHGYRAVCQFDGGLAWKGSIVETDSIEIYMRDDIADARIAYFSR